MHSSKRLAAVCIALNALTAGSIFCWPVFGPRIREDLGLTLTETNAIWSAAIVGQYASSAFMGSISDNYGPRPLSLLAALLFGSGYFLMAQTERGAVVTLSGQSHSVAFVAMAAFFVLVGAGVAASLFSALCSSSAHFKSNPGLALSIPLTLFSLSSLFLSSIASLSYFTDPRTGDLDSPRWIGTLGASLMIVNAFSAYGLSVPAEEDQRQEHHCAPERAIPHENTPLLPSTSAVVTDTRLAYSMPPRYPSTQNSTSTTPLLTSVEFLCTPSAWILGFVLFAAVGASEMVMSSIGSVVFSLKSAAALQQHDEGEINREILIIRTRQVQLIAIANTASRLFVGLASDLVSPSRSKHYYQESWKQRILNIRISRVTLLLAGLSVLTISFLSASLTLDSINQLWMVSIATGLGYGLIFTLIPTLIMRTWPRQFGRNFGILNYMAALGSLTFSMLFAFVNDYVALHDLSPSDDSSKRQDPTVKTAATCHLGRRCFAPSLFIAAMALIAAFLFTLPLWKAWRHFV